MGVWMLVYKDLKNNVRVNAEERKYILQDTPTTLQETYVAMTQKLNHKPMKYTAWQCLRLPQTWGIFLAKFLTDGVWWFFLFWTPAYISDVYGFASDSVEARIALLTLYSITILAIFGSRLPTILHSRLGGNILNAPA